MITIPTWVTQALLAPQPFLMALAWFIDPWLRQQETFRKRLPYHLSYGCLFGLLLWFAGQVLT